MRAKFLSSVEWITLLGFAVALSILLAIGVMTNLFLAQTRANDRLVEHSHYVIENLQACLMAGEEMETSARAYVLRGDYPSLKAYKSSEQNLDKALLTVQELTVDNIAQQHRILLQLRPLIDQRLALASRVMEARHRAGQQAAIAILFEHHVLALIDQVHQVSDQMQTEERSLLKIRMAQHAESSHKLHIMIQLGSAVAILFLVVASMWIHRDVVVRQHVEQELRRSEARLQKQAAELQAINRELESFSYSVSHDLRAPLRGIEGFSEIILTNYKNRLDAEGQSYFERICAAARRMGVLIDEILNLSRISRTALKMEEVDLAPVARDISEELQKSDPSRHVTWTIPKSLPIRGDSSLLHIALMNLLSNAWKFTSKAPQASIEIGKMVKDGESVYFVRDNGAGFDMAYQGKLFQAFQRLHSSKEFPGTGIGLAIVQRVIHRHGGRIWAQGEVGHGAAFYFTL